MKSIYLLAVVLLFSININAQNFVSQKGGHSYTMDIPRYMMKSFELNDAASLQYQNAVKEAYVITIEDSKEELQSLGMLFLNPTEFLENFIEEYQVNAENRALSPIAEFINNGNNHSQIEMTWTEEGTGFYMLITVVETKTHFYKVLCWTLAEYKDSLKNDYLTISKSLKD
ncbi:hypothetical protein [Lutibacter sp.]|uniref:hypothetical protein n=1 Tax=Lutibacter sp. TaxID=1925666 RepID=UPI0035696E0F